MPRDVYAFFEQYRDAFDRLDGDAIAALYAVPSGIAQDGKYEHWPSDEPIKRNMVPLCELYRQRGYTSASFKPGMFHPQGEQFAVADLRWRIEWGRAQEPWQFNTTYNMVRTPAGWRILLCTAYAEAALHNEDAV